MTVETFDECELYAWTGEHDITCRRQAELAALGSRCACPCDCRYRTTDEVCTRCAHDRHRRTLDDVSGLFRPSRAELDTCFARAELRGLRVATRPTTTTWERRTPR